MDLGLHGRATVVAGGTRGVGRATAELLAAEGLPRRGARAHAEPPPRGRGGAARRRRRGRHRPRVRPARHRRGRGRVHVPRRALGRVPRARQHRRSRARRRARRPHRRRVARRVRPRRAHDDPHDPRRAAAAAQGDVRARRERRRVVDPSPEPRAHRVHRVEGGDGERVEEPVACARPRGDHREHGGAGHGDVADARRLPRRHRPRRPARRARSKPPTRPSPATTARRTTSAGSGSRRRSRPWWCSSARSSAASWSARPSPSTAAPTSSDRVEAPDGAHGVQPRRPVGSGSSTRSPTTRRWSAATAASPTPRPTSAPPGSRTTSPRLGIGAGDHVALYLYNGTEYLEAMLAAFKLRAVPINVNYRYVEDELRYLLDDADAAAVVFHREFAPKLAAIRADAARSCTTFVAVDDGTDAPTDRAGARRASSTRPRSPPRSADARLRPALGRRPLHPLHRRHHRHAEGRDVARRGHLLRRVRRRGTSATRRSPRPRRSSTRLDLAPPRACPRARSCTAPRTGWRSARSTPAARSSSRPSAASTPSTLWRLDRARAGRRSS